MSTSKVPTRSIGDREFSAVSFGAMSFASFYGKVDLTDNERFAVLDRAYELGCRHWDTADVYGESEALIGQWFKRTGKRADIFLATKFGFTHTDNTTGVRGDAQYVRECVEKSLQTLGTDYIDLLYLHRVDSNVPVEETVGAMAEFVRAGKVRYLGLSECSSSSLRRAHATHPIATLEVEYSPFMMFIEDPKVGLLKTARELGVKVVAYSPMGRGLLTGRFKSLEDFETGDFRTMIPLYKDNFPKILAIVDNLTQIGAKHGATPAQVALAWLLAQGDDIIPIPGTKSVKYLEENVAAAHVTLSEDEVQAVRRSIVDAGLTTADRYPPGYMGQLLAESPPLKK